MKAHLDVEVRDSVYPPGQPRGPIFYEKSAERPRYRVWLYLDGPDLPYVRTVTYTLHPTFPNPIRTVERTAANPTCALQIWTWGTFAIHVEIESKDGGRVSTDYRMNYSSEITADAEYKEVAAAM